VLDKLKYYVSDSIHAIVWKGQENLTAKDYYDTMNTLLLRTTTRSIVQLEKCLNSCRMRDGRLLEWMCAMDNIYVEFAQAGEPKSDAAMKAHAMAKCGRKWEAIGIFWDRMTESVTFNGRQPCWRRSVRWKKQELMGSEIWPAN
jgi:hypothetical protein